MTQFFWGILKMFSICHIFIRTYNSWPWKFAGGKKIFVASPTKILEIPYAIGGNAPSLLTRPQWKTLCQEPYRYCKPLEITINLLFLLKPIYVQKNQRHSSIQSEHIADLILRITSGRPRCAWPHPYEWTESNRFVYL